MEMGRRWFLAMSGLAPLAAVAPGQPGPSRSGDGRCGHRFAFAPDGSGFLLDCQRFQIRSGEMHPARIPVEHWRHRIQLAKAMGLNTISIYVMWNYVEPSPGVFDFRSERRNVEAFVRLCQAEGMWVLLRPGPYVCGEWDLGGIPPYLLATKDIRLRVHDDERYMAAVRRYIGQLASRIRPLMVGNGGPILMVQIENEYGSYGSDPTYLDQLRQLWLAEGIDGPFYTEDGLGQLEHNHSNVSGGAIALSGGDAPSIAAARKAYPTVPAMAGEVYPGWLTHWGDKDFAGPTDISGDLDAFMAEGLSFNLYMLHGGTSFGFYAGANANDLSGAYQPDVTSYDYAAPISEQGVATPEFHRYRSLIGSYGVTLPAIPAPKPTIVPAPVTPTVYASLWDNLPDATTSPDPVPFEMLGQSYGFALYRTTIAGTGALDIRWVHDYATVFVDGHYQGGLSRTLIPAAESTKLNVTNNNAPLTLTTSGAMLDILVEGTGRTNYGQAIVDRKGILESASLQGKTLKNWQIFPLPMDDLGALKPTTTDPQRPGLFFKATLHLAETGDTYLDLSRWTKGVVWVNGHNLGRYWEIGPQHRLFCPVSWLRPGRNEILVFDLHQTTPQPISFAATLS
jgi:beta-galactosidase